MECEQGESSYLFWNRMIRSCQKAGTRKPIEEKHAVKQIAALGNLYDNFMRNQFVYSGTK